MTRRGALGFRITQSASAKPRVVSYAHAFGLQRRLLARGTVACAATCEQKTCAPAPVKQRRGHQPVAVTIRHLLRRPLVRWRDLLFVFVRHAMPTAGNPTGGIIDPSPRVSCHTARTNGEKWSASTLDWTTGGSRRVHAQKEKPGRPRCACAGPPGAAGSSIPGQLPSRSRSHSSPALLGPRPEPPGRTHAAPPVRPSNQPQFFPSLPFSSLLPRRPDPRQAAGRKQSTGQGRAAGSESRAGRLVRGRLPLSSAGPWAGGAWRRRG